jgi:2-polyprenyl-3-methyl-5-hydroxy-6-metoxy-1,4-benzoquinol methylase
MSMGDPYPATEFDHRFARRKRLDFIAGVLRSRFAGRPPGSVTVLDLGCGTGNISLPLARLGYRVFALDVDRVSLICGRRRSAGPSPGFLNMDAARLGFRGRFDAIVCSELIEHLPRPESMLCLLPSHLSPGGVVMITTPNGVGPFEASSQLFHMAPLRLLQAAGLGPWLRDMRRRLCGVPHGVETWNRAHPTCAFSPWGACAPCSSGAVCGWSRWRIRTGWKGPFRFAALSSDFRVCAAWTRPWPTVCPAGW